jgi:hypothetical protein
MKTFLKDRLRLVRELMTSGPTVAYADLCLILCAVLSACAAIRWPGNRIDRKRFVELLVRHSNPDHNAHWISVPALLNKGLLLESATPYGHGHSNRIFIDSEIDMDVAKARVAYPNVAVSKLRKNSYACLIYEWIRCGYAHEYCLKGNASSIPSSDRPAKVSYILSGHGPSKSREAHFHIEYLIALAEHHVDLILESPDRTPEEWWIDAHEGT